MKDTKSLLFTLHKEKNTYKPITQFTPHSLIIFFLIFFSHSYLKCSIERVKSLASLVSPFPFLVLSGQSMSRINIGFFEPSIHFQFFFLKERYPSMAVNYARYRCFIQLRRKKSSARGSEKRRFEAELRETTHSIHPSRWCNMATKNLARIWARTYGVSTFV